MPAAAIFPELPTAGPSDVATDGHISCKLPVTGIADVAMGAFSEPLEGRTVPIDIKELTEGAPIELPIPNCGPILRGDDACLVAPPIPAGAPIELPDGYAAPMVRATWGDDACLVTGAVTEDDPAVQHADLCEEIPAQPLGADTCLVGACWTGAPWRATETVLFGVGV